jgi:hypothetical protein
MTEDFVLLCPNCGKEVSECGKDDIQTWYSCENGHKTANPKKHELDGIEILQKQICKAIEKNPALGLLKYQQILEKEYPPYRQFCDNVDQDFEFGKYTCSGFKTARVAQWLTENEHFKTDIKNDILYFGDITKGICIQMENP